jgi:tRNA/rRNA methyltransferase
VRRAWLEQRGYRVIDMTAAGIEADVTAELGRLEADMAKEGRGE